MDVADNHEGYM